MNIFSNRAPCTNWIKGGQKDRTKTLAEFADLLTFKLIYN